MKCPNSLFRYGICLPSSTSLALEDQICASNQVRATVGSGPLPEIQEEPVAAN